MAIVSARKARLQHWSVDGRTGAGRALALANKPANFISTLQFGITIISILSGAMGEANLSKLVVNDLSQVTWLQPYVDRLAFWIPVGTPSDSKANQAPAYAHFVRASE